MAWVSIGTAAVNVLGAAYANNQQKKNANKTIDSATQIVEGLDYAPIDIEKLKADATQNAITNATNSLALERSLMPDVANTRSELARQVSSDLALGGKLPTDVINRVETAGRTIGARSGVGTGSTTPLTASLLGISSIDLLNQRRSAAERLIAANDLPTAGLDPGQIASAEIANTMAQNQFDLEKSGVSTNLLNSESQARAAQLGGQMGLISGVVSGLGKIVNRDNDSSNLYGDLLSKVPKKQTSNSILGGGTPIGGYDW